MSRYADSETEMRVYRGKMIRGRVPRRNPQFTFSFTVHQIGDDAERPDLTAYYYYNDPRLWYMIADANPERMYWGDLKPGEAIRVPYV